MVLPFRGFLISRSLIACIGLASAGRELPAALIDPLPAGIDPAVLEGLRASATAGNGPDALRLGLLYAEGRSGVPVDARLGETWLRKAVQLGERKAFHPLGRLLLETSDKGKDAARAAEGLRILEQGASTEPACNLSLGLLYAGGVYGPQDFARSEAYFRAAAGQGDSAALYRLGWLLSGEAGVPGGARPQEAIEPLEKAFLDGSVEAGELLVRLLRDGSRLVKDPARAFHAVSAAAARGHVEAKFFEGQMYEEGVGTPPAPAKALECYREAASRGSAMAQNKLGLLHWTGAGVPRDPAEARKWFELAIARGLAQAHYNLALLLDSEAARQGAPENGTTAPEGLEAARHLLVAAQSGMAEAQDRMGSWYRDGRNLVRDLLAARAWFATSAGNGHVDSKVNLAQVMEMTANRADALPSALSLYREAAATGHPAGHFHVARLLLSGAAGRVDLVNGYAHLSAAAEAGFGPARENLRGVQPLLTPEQLSQARTAQQRLKANRWKE